MDWKAHREIEEAIDSSGVIKDDGNAYMEIVSFVFLYVWVIAINDFAKTYLTYGIGEFLSGVLVIGYIIGRIVIGRVVANTVFVITVIYGIHSIVSH